MAELTAEEQLTTEVLELETFLNEENPNFPNLLALIHRKLAEHPQLVQSLTDEEIGIICKSLSVYTTEVITTTKPKPKKVALKNLSASDLL